MMTDDELVKFLGLTCDGEAGVNFVKRLSPTRRALYERMSTIDMEFELWQAGLGPKPEGFVYNPGRRKKR